MQQSPIRNQQDLQAALAEAEPGAIALVSDNLVENLAQLAQVAARQNSALILLTARHQSIPFSELPSIRGALRHNADARQLLACLHAVAAGERWTAPASQGARDTTGARVLAQLSPRQLQVMSGVSRGAKNIDIARKLGTSEQVVKNMLGGIYDLTGVSDRLELALFVLHHPELAEAARAASSEDSSS